MKAESPLILVVLLIGLTAACVAPRPAVAPTQEQEISIIPKPVSLIRQPGFFLIAADARIIVPESDARAAETGRYLAGRLRTAFGLEIPFSSQPPAAGASPVIVLRRGGRPDLGAEGYELSVTPAAITIDAPEAAGLFYGVQTLFQLLPPEAYGGAGSAGGPARLACVRIEDKPRLPWRGMLLDCSRHFFPKEFVEKYLDYLAMHKMNTFHWHLTDDQGWRIEIKKYPRLTEVGAWRVDREDKDWNSRPAQQPGEKATYGGFYTQDDIREVLAYAAERHITVVPEIEMPGHATAALAAYPALGCSGGPYTVKPGGIWPITEVYCPGNDETFAFLQDILSEVIDLFPSRIIHIGGDEVDKSTWKVCPKCQARMKAEGLKNEEELQSWFTRRIEAFLNSRGRTLMGWDEILEGGLAPNAAVMSWRGIEGGIAAAKAGHAVVMTPTSNCYYDYYQGDPSLEPPAIGGYLPLSKAYDFEPVPAALSAEEARFIIGAQANLWAEYIATPSHAEYMTFPRIAAIAEAGWTPAAGKDWNNFLRRMTVQFQRYDRLGVNYAKSVYTVKLDPVSDAASGGMTLTMSSESYRPDIRYTLDGTEPQADSKAYAGPLEIGKSAVIKAGVFADGKLQGTVSETRFLSHQALGKAPELKSAFKPRYSAGGPLGLVDGLRGGKSHTDGRWQGFEGD
ncbi:MAG: family 20 glycosylhydrolase, partial [Acidobacteriota bacterium]|nr:family 20 glycosylhydrolase [Acidobacteriota bacterium]